MEAASSWGPQWQSHQGVGSGDGHGCGHSDPNSSGWLSCFQLVTCHPNSLLCMKKGSREQFYPHPNHSHPSQDAAGVGSGVEGKGPQEGCPKVHTREAK